MESSQFVLDASMQSMLEAIIYPNIFVRIDTGRAFICPPKTMRGDVQRSVDSAQENVNKQYGEVHKKYT